MSAEGGIEDGDLGLGFGLKPGSLITPADFNHSCLQSFHNVETKDNDHDVTPSQKPFLNGNTTSRAETIKRSSLLSALLDSNFFLNRRSGGLFRKREFQYDQEVELFNYELDSLKKQLLSKQQAIKILQQQLKSASNENEKLEKTLKWVNETLIKDFNNLQFSVERERLVTIESRENLLSKIDHLEAENKCLKWSVDKQRDELNSQRDISCCSSPPLSHPINGWEDDISFEPHQNIKLEPADCYCSCLEYKKCPCAKYADKLVARVYWLESELQQYKAFQCRCYQPANHQNFQPPETDATIITGVSPSSTHPASTSITSVTDAPRTAATAASSRSKTNIPLSPTPGPAEDVDRKSECNGCKSFINGTNHDDVDHFNFNKLLNRRRINKFSRVLSSYR